MDLVKYQNNNFIQSQNVMAVMAAERAKAEIQAACLMALQNPRDPHLSRLRVIKECERPEFAEKVSYEIPFGHSSVKGPTIRLAEEIAKNWKNLRITSNIMHESELNLMISVTVTDLENNITYDDMLKIPKFVELKYNRDNSAVSERLNSAKKPVYFCPATEDEIKKMSGSGKSKLIRNCILRMIPHDFISECLRVANETLAKSDREDPEAAKLKMISSFVKIGVMPNQLSTFLGHDIDFLNIDEINKLRQIYRGIKEGQKWEDYAAEVAETRHTSVESKKDDHQKNKKIYQNAFLDKFKESGFDLNEDLVDFVQQHLQKNIKKVKVTEEEYMTLTEILQKMITAADEVTDEK